MALINPHKTISIRTVLVLNKIKIKKFKKYIYKRHYPTYPFSPLTIFKHN
ncbi:hypothetical protein Hanom_Chr12g01136991 [Helianthus anomalus]